MTKLYIGNKGWTGNIVHAIKVNESGNPVHPTDSNLCFDRSPVTITPVTRLKKVEATIDNVTCKNCLKRLEGDH